MYDLYVCMLCSARMYVCVCMYDMSLCTYGCYVCKLCEYVCVANMCYNLQVMLCWVTMLVMLCMHVMCVCVVRMLCMNSVYVYYV